jgi:hypothetical protein
MGTTINYQEIILKDLEELTPELIREVIDFIEFLKSKRIKKSGVNYNSLLIQQESLNRIWDKESEDLYEV